MEELKLKKNEVKAKKTKMSEQEVFGEMVKAMDVLFSNMKFFKSELDMHKADLLKSHEKIHDLEWELRALKVGLGIEEEEPVDYSEYKEVEPFVWSKDNG